MMYRWNGEALIVFRIVYVPLVIISGLVFCVSMALLAISIGPCIYFAIRPRRSRPRSYFKVLLPAACAPVALVVISVIAALTCAWFGVAVILFVCAVPLYAWKISTGNFTLDDAARHFLLPAYILVHAVMGE
jgi:hypothetical protein